MNQNEDDSFLWLNYAKEDLQAALILIENENTSCRNAAYLLQQAAEKAIKACYIFENKRFEKTHNLDALRNNLSGNWEWKSLFRDLSALTALNIESRYPGDWDEISMNEAKDLYKISFEIVQKINDEIYNRLGTSKNKRK